MSVRGLENLVLCGELACLAGLCCIASEPAAPGPRLSSAPHWGPQNNAHYGKHAAPKGQFADRAAHD